MRKLLKVPQVSEILGVPDSWIYGRVHAGTLPFPYLKIGSYLRFRPEDIEDYIENGLRATGDGRAGNTKKKDGKKEEKL